MTIVELALLIIVGTQSFFVARSLGAKDVLAILVGVGASVLTYLIATS